MGQVMKEEIKKGVSEATGFAHNHTLLLHFDGAWDLGLPYGMDARGSGICKVRAY